ncbi:hypothetical protein ADUPG1_006185, partial [Aduncisulcus paluster]
MNLTVYFVCFVCILFTFSEAYPLTVASYNSSVITYSTTSLLFSVQTANSGYYTYCISNDVGECSWRSASEMEWKTIYFNGTPSTPTISYEEFLPLIIEDGSLTVTFYFCYYNDASHMTESEISEEDSFRFDVSVGSELEMTGMPEKLDQYLSFELFLSTNGYLHSYDMSIYLSIFSENFVNTGKGGD